MDYRIALIIGVGFGFMTAVFGQKHLNKFETSVCRNKADSYQLVTIRSRIGDARYCMDKRYL